jgi:hypothetical protein
LRILKVAPSFLRVQLDGVCSRKQLGTRVCVTAVDQRFNKRSKGVAHTSPTNLYIGSSLPRVARFHNVLGEGMLQRMIALGGIGAYHLPRAEKRSCALPP